LNQADRGSIVYPVYPALTPLERVMRKLGFGGAARCPVCGSLTLITRVGSNLRETGRCIRCKCTNRQRQLALVACAAAAEIAGRRVGSLRALAKLRDLVIYNTEAERQIHRQLEAMPGYICSDYFGKNYRSGDMVGGRMHQDLMELSFEDSSIDLVLSSDVFEHIPYPYKAHREVFRVLRPGGRHVFTVPFLQTRFLDEARTHIDDRGNVVMTKEPIYHGDPMRKEGALVHRIFALEMLVNLAKIGFKTNMYRLRKPLRGIIGPNALVFEAIKER
jgi:SAM-dependent methyltransferase